MVYNKTKRTTEKVAAIIGVVEYSIKIVACITLICAGIYFLNNAVVIDTWYIPREFHSTYYNYTYGYWEGYWTGGYYSDIWGIDYKLALGYLIPGIVEIGIAIAGLILSAKLIKSPIKADGTIKKRTGSRVTLLIFSILSSSIVGIILWIIVLCMKDFVNSTISNQETTTNVGGNEPQYNKSKRILEKVSAIITVVFASIKTLLALVYVCIIAYYVSDYGLSGIYFFYAGSPYLILLAFSIVCLILGALLIKSPVKPDGSLQKRTGKRITLLVFSILTLGIAEIVLWIIVLCLKDYKGETAIQNNVQQVNPTVSVRQQTVARQEENTSSSIDAKIAKLKEFKSLGIITEVTFNKAVAKLISDATKDE